MSDFRVGDKVVFAGNIDDIAPIWQPAMERARIDPVTVINIEKDRITILMPFDEAPCQEATLLRKRLELYQEDINETQLIGLL